MWSLEFGVIDLEVALMNQENTIKSKSKKPAVRIVNLYKYLTSEKREYVMSKQILKEI